MGTNQSNQNGNEDPEVEKNGHGGAVARTPSDTVKSKSSLRQMADSAKRRCSNHFNNHSQQQHTTTSSNKGNSLNNPTNSGPYVRPHTSLDERDTELIDHAINHRKDEWYIEPDRKRELRECWFSLKTSMDQVGVVMFLKLFETHPETLKPFIPNVNSLKELELDEWYRENLKVHSIRVMAIIEKTMHRLDDEKRAAVILTTYGKRHNGFGVTKHMLGLMANSFIRAIQPDLEERWCKETEQAWQDLFRFIVFFMRLGYPNEDTTTTNSNETENVAVAHEETGSKIRE